MYPIVYPKFEGKCWVAGLAMGPLSDLDSHSKLWTDKGCKLIVSRPTHSGTLTLAWYSVSWANWAQWRYLRKLETSRPP